MNYEIFTEKNFHGAIIDTKASILSLKISVDIHEAQTTAAFATALIYAELLMSGAGPYSRSQLQDALGLLGADITVSFTLGSIDISLTSLDTVAKKALALLQYIITEPQCKVAELQRISTQLQNELIEYEENAREQADNHFRNALYGTHDRRFTPKVQSLHKALTGVTVADIAALHTKVLQSHWIVTTAGKPEVTALALHCITKCTNQTSIQASPKSSHEPINILGTKTILTNVPSKQNIEFSIGSDVPLTLAHTDYPAFLFGLAVLGKWGGFAGRLMSTVREKEGFTYGIYARTETTTIHETGYWRIMTFFTPEKSVAGLKATLREVQLMHKKGITKDEYERFLTILHTNQTLMADSIGKQVATIHGYITAGFKTKEDIEEFRTRLTHVTIAEVNRAMKQYLNPKQLIISGAGPIQSVEQAIKNLY